MEELEAKIKDLDLEQANMIVEEEGKILRVTKQDDNFLICTCDYCTHRVNVEVVKNKVVKILSVGQSNLLFDNEIGMQLSLVERCVWGAEVARPNRVIPTYKGVLMSKGRDNRKEKKSPKKKKKKKGDSKQFTKLVGRL